MNKEYNKKKLEEEKELLESELKELGRKNKETGTWEAVPEAQTSPESDPNDLSDRSEDYEERSSIVAPLSARLEDIDSALGKIETNQYGICEACNQEIEEDRLEANPAALTCKNCMEKVL